MTPKKLKIFIVTYRRNAVLNDTLDQLFNKTDFVHGPEVEVNIINNHSDFCLDEAFRDRVNVLDNQVRPDWDTGNLSQNWNQALVHGFKDLNAPEAEIVTTMQNDIVLNANWYSNLLKMHEKYTFIAGCRGDNIVSYHPEAVKKIGLWDERFLCPCNKEADYYIRALIFNKDKSCVNDRAHKRFINNENALPLDSGGRGTGDELDSFDWVALKTKMSRDAWYHTTQIFYWKWKDTWKTQPSYNGWLLNWPKDFVDNPPLPPKVPSFIQYHYFEKDIEMHDKNYVGWRLGDLWLDHNCYETGTGFFTAPCRSGDIDVHPYLPDQPYRKL